MTQTLKITGLKQKSKTDPNTRISKPELHQDKGIH